MEIIFTFSSANHCIWGESCLLSAGYYVQVMPLPSVIQAGCGLCLRLLEKDVLAAKSNLMQAGVEIKEIYIREIVEGKSSYLHWEEKDERK